MNNTINRKNFSLGYLNTFSLSVILTLLICLSLFIAPAKAANLSAKQMLGKSSPEFNLSDLTNKQHSLADWHGKLILINFWATWCLPCKKEIPLLNKLQNQYEEDGFQVVGIAIDNSAAIKKFTQSIPIDYINLLAGDNSAQLVKRFGNHSGALPYTVIIDQQGKIVEIASGQLTEKYLKRVIEKYL